MCVCVCGVYVCGCVGAVRDRVLTAVLQPLLNSIELVSSRLVKHPNGEPVVVVEAWRSMYLCAAKEGSVNTLKTHT